MVPVLPAPAHHYVFGRRGRTLAEGNVVTKRRIGSNTPLLAMHWRLDSFGGRVLQEKEYGL